MKTIWFCGELYRNRQDFRVGLSKWIEEMVKDGSGEQVIDVVIRWEPKRYCFAADVNYGDRGDSMPTFKAQGPFDNGYGLTPILLSDISGMFQPLVLEFEKQLQPTPT